MIIAASLLAAPVLSCGLLAGDDAVSPDYGPVSEPDYVRGRFDPVKHPHFVKLANLGIPCDRPHYLRKEAAESLKKMYLSLKKDLPGVKFWVQSSTRNWDTQKAIWERRWAELASGKKKMTGQQIADAILRSSSVPGTSRHHWGSDFDINVLKNAYYESGNGAKLYVWLKSHANEFGFCQPFSAGRKAGYMEERWHWSYMPLSRDFQRRWNEHFGENPGLLVKDGDFKGSPHSVKYAPVNVNSINQSCLEK